MAVVCPLCGAENRDNARFCLGCAASLGPLDGATPVPRRRSSRRTGRSRSSRNGRGGWSFTWKTALGLVVFALVLFAAAWWAVVSPADRPAPATPITLVPAPPTMPQAAPGATSAVPVSDGAEAPTGPAVSAEERLRESVSELERQDRLHSFELERERAKIAQEVQRSHEARRRAGTPALPRPVGAEPDAIDATTLSEDLSTPAAQSASPAPPVRPAETTANVEQICAGSGNFLARDFCRMRECAKPAFASDPVCVRFRQMDEARRQQSD